MMTQSQWSGAELEVWVSLVALSHVVRDAWWWAEHGLGFCDAEEKAQVSGCESHFSSSFPGLMV